MRITICELPHDAADLAAAWTALCAHTWQQESELVLLPEFAMLDPVWEGEKFDPVRWAFAEQVSDGWMLLLRELHAEQVVGTRPVTVDGAH